MRSLSTHLKLVATVITLVFSTCGLAAVDQNIKLSLEEPASAGSYSGVSNLRGWAVSKQGIDRIELYVNNQYVSDIPYGGLRSDVGTSFPSFPNSDQSGYSMAYNYKSLNAGTAEILVRAYNSAGDYNDAQASFSVIKFKSSFISNPAEIKLKNASQIKIIDNNSLEISGATIENDNWDLQLKWTTATQGFEIESAKKTNGKANYLNSASGYWKIPEFGNQGALPIYLADGTEPRKAQAIFLVFTNYTFGVASGTAASNVLTFAINDDPDLSANGTITFTSATSAKLYIANCTPNPGESCAPFTSGASYDLAKEF